MNVGALFKTSVNYIPYSARDYIRRVPGLASLQRLIIQRFMSGSPFVHTVNAGPARGLKFEVTLPADKAIWAGTYERQFAEAIAAAIEAGDVCYDVGGYRGYMAAAMALSGASEVFVFEPLPANQDALRSMISLNPDLPISLKSLALGASEGAASLSIMPELSMAKLAASTFQPGAAPLTSIEVDLRTIDGLVSEGALPPPAFMKIDVEGSEYEVLTGAETVLRKYKPIVFIEMHSRELEASCSGLLSALGYELRRLGPAPRQGEEVSHFACHPV